jgi:hypothetical protein
LKLTKGNGFKTPRYWHSRKSENQASVSVEIMNGAALALNTTPAPAEFEARVKSTVGTEVMVSNVLELLLRQQLKVPSYISL